MLRESASVTKLIYKIVVVGSPEHFYELYDVDVIDFGQNCNLVVGEFTEFRCMFELFYVHDLDSVKSFRLFVFGFVDVAVLSLTDLL